MHLGSACEAREKTRPAGGHGRRGKAFVHGRANQEGHGAPRSSHGEREMTVGRATRLCDHGRDGIYRPGVGVGVEVEVEMVVSLGCLGLNVGKLTVRGMASSVQAGLNLVVCDARSFFWGVSISSG